MSFAFVGVYISVHLILDGEVIICCTAAVFACARSFNPTGDINDFSLDLRPVHLLALLNVCCRSGNHHPNTGNQTHDAHDAEYDSKNKVSLHVFCPNFGSGLSEMPGY